ncbi:hypothetical protein LCGC14_0271310 [marine sediment metagenome]|uniref:Uncharacterized protein n=1 Tax=marine sediment metagenome TaxID=412755 RepID=A0A0F9UG02_9ZZZZ
MITKEGFEFLRASAQDVGIDGHFDLMALDNIEGVFTNHMDALVALAGSDEIAQRVAEGHGEADHDGFMGSDAAIFARKLNEHANERDEMMEDDNADELRDMAATFLLFWNAASDELEQIIAPKEAEMAIEPEM